MIYLDHAAATPVDSAVMQKMLPYFEAQFANPSSVYQFGVQARQAVDEARKNIAEIIKSKPEEGFFTSGGTEANNWALFGVAEANKDRGMHLITTVVEHHSVFHAMQALELRGFRVTYLPVDHYGYISLEDFQKALTPETILVSIMYGNNEIGTVEHIAEIGKIIREYEQVRDDMSRFGSQQRGFLPAREQKRIFFHTDACQAAGALPLNVEDLGVDLMTINSGKIYGPKGAGALYVRAGTRIFPLLYGGGQEHRLRAGTENVPAIVGFAEALKIAEKLRENESERLMILRDQCIHTILSNIPGSRLNGDPVYRLPNNINISFEGVDGESLLLRLDMEGICASSGSACTSGSLEPSHVLLGIGLSRELAKGSLRLTLGRGTTEEDIQKAAEILMQVVKKLRQTSM